MNSLISEFPELIIDKYFSIVSFDSDSFLPTESELKRGWIYENEIAYFDEMTEFELSQKSLFDIYDQWLIFEKKQRLNNSLFTAYFSKKNMIFDEKIISV